MRPLVALFAVALISSTGFARAAQNSAAQNPAAQDSRAGVLTLARALEQAPAADPDVLAAEAGLAAARRDLKRLQADPLALKVPLLEARGTVEGARSARASARLTARAEVTAAYFGALTADRALRLAELTVALQEARLAATQIRADAGAATNLELAGAENNLAEAQRGHQDAAQARALAYSELGNLSGEVVTRLVTVDLVPPAVPTLAASLEAARGGADTALEIARAQLAAVDNAFSAQIDIDAARDALASAEIAQKTNRRSRALSVRQAHGALRSAARAFENARAIYAASQAELAAARARLEAGSLAPISYREAELAHLETEAALYGALYTFRLSALGLEQTVAGDGSSSVPGLDTPVPATDPAIDTVPGTEPAAPDSGEQGE